MKFFIGQVIKEEKMGSWGPGLYQNDIAEDIKDYYNDQLRRGKKSEEITHELINQNHDIIFDNDDAPIFWFALADTQWNLGRLENSVKEKALFYLNLDNDFLYREVENIKFANKRYSVLKALKEKLLTQPPKEKKITPYKFYHCEWKIGDIYAYQLTSEYAEQEALFNKYLFFVKVGEKEWHPGHIIPVVYFYQIVSEKILTLKEIVKLPYIPQFYTPKAYKDNPNMQKLYRLSFLSTSKRIIPNKQLTFLGNIETVKHIDNESLNSFDVSWKDFENYIVDNFQNWNN